MMENKKYFLCFCLITAFFFCSGPLVASDYQELERMLAADRFPDSEFIKKIPEPSSPSEYYLYSRVAGQFSEALEALAKAVELVESARKAEFLTEWVRLLRLSEPQENQIDFLQKNISSIEHVPPGLWLEAAELVETAGKNELAKKWYSEARQAAETKSDALLGLIRLSIAGKNHSETEQLFEEYLLEVEDETSPEYWLLKGRFYQQSGSDSEAYVAYSHLIRHYPDSLFLTRAETEIEKLPLPENLAPPERQPEEDKDEPQKAPGGPYWVQVGSFTRRSQSEALAVRMERELGYKPAIISAEVSGQTYYRVRIGGFQSRSEANEILSEVKQQGVDGFIARE